MKQIITGICAVLLCGNQLTASNQFVQLELSPFATPADLEQQYAQIVEKQVGLTNSTQERKNIRVQLSKAYKDIQKADGRRLVLYNLLVNGSQNKQPRFQGLTSTESGDLAGRMLQMRRTIGSRLLSGPGANIIDSNDTIEKDYEYRKKVLNEHNGSQEEKNAVEQAYIVLTEPWRWKEFLDSQIVERMNMTPDQAQEYAQQQTQETQKRKQNELNEQRERERIAQEKADADRKTKEAEQERLKKEQDRKKYERLAKEREEQARETARRNQEEQDRIQIQKEREEKERQKASQQEIKEISAPAADWKAPSLVLGTSFKVSEATAKKVTFELKNKTRNYTLGVELLQDGNQKKSITAAYKDDAFVSASTGKNEEDHGYLRLIGLDVKKAYKLIISLRGQSGILTSYTYELKANKDRKAIILTFEQDSNEFLLRPQKGAFLSSVSQSGLPLDGNIKASDIKSLGLLSK